jgi:hypothetical protein
VTRRAAGASPFEADLEARIGALFRRCPTLCGFTVQDAASELLVTEVSVYPSDGREARGELYREILAALVQLIDEYPETRELLRERTFARILH